jgi:hypothetical protein
VLIGLMAAMVLSMLAWVAPAQAVADPVHAVQATIPDATRGSNATVTFNPSPTGQVNYITFTPAYGMKIVSATGCPTNNGLPTESAFTCVNSPGYSFSAPITLTLYVGAAKVGDAGYAVVGQTDGTVVTDKFYVNVVYSRAIQAGAPVTAPGSTGTTTFNPDHVGAIKWVVFEPPPNVAITGATGCPEATSLPTSSTFVCRSGAQTFDSPVTLTYFVGPAAPVGTALTGIAKVGQWDDKETWDNFVVKTSPGVADPVHAVPASVVNATRGQDVVVTFDPSPTGSVNAIDFTPPAGISILSSTGCPSTAGLPTSSTYHCATSAFSFTGQIKLTVRVGSGTSAGIATGYATVAQTDNSQVTDQWFVQVSDTRAIQQGVPLTAPGLSGSTTFNPDPAGDVNFVVFVPPADVAITGATGCPEASSLPTSSTFVCRSGAQTFASPITLTYQVGAAAPLGATLSGVAKVGQSDGSINDAAFAVITPPMVTDPVHAVAESSVNATRGSDVVLTFNPSPSGTVQAIDFTPPPGMTILSSTGCPSNIGLPTSSTYHCATSQTTFGAAIKLTVRVNAPAPAGNGVGTAVVTQTDSSQVTNQWSVQVNNTRAIQQSVPVTAPGAAGSTMFNPQNAGEVHWVTFDPPAGVTITGATGCPQADTLPKSTTFVCKSGAQTFDSAITLTYSVASSVAASATLAGSVKVGQADDTITTDAFGVSTPEATPAPPAPPAQAVATKVTAAHVSEPSAYGQGSSVKVTVFRDGTTGDAPTGTVTLTDSAGTVVASGQLTDGVTTLALSPTLPIGTSTMLAKYAGTAAFAASQAPVTVTVKKATSILKAKRPKKKPVYKADFKIKVTVKAAGLVPTGKVKITYQGKPLGKGKLKNGKVTIKITKDLKVGTRKLLVTYRGSSTTLPSKRKVKVVVVKA